MDWSVVVTALVLGFAASLSCLGLCIPILIPYIVERDRSPKEGLRTSALFSFGRLIIYFAIGMVVFAIGSTITDEAPEEWLKVAVAVLGVVVILYGLWIVFKLPKPKWCPAALAKHFRPAFSVILGLLIGSFFCPALWMALVGATLTGNFPTMIATILVFWGGSSVAILTAGTLSGEMGGRFQKRLGPEKLRDIMGMVLIGAGAFYLVNGLAG